MSTLQVDKINSFTPSLPVEINDSFKVTGSSQFTGSVNIQAPHTITGTTASFVDISVNGGKALFGTRKGISVIGDISGSGTGSFIGLGVNTQGAPVAPGTISGSGFNIAPTITANTGSFEHSLINHLRIAGGGDVALGGISVGGNGTISCSSTAGIDTKNLSIDAAGGGGIQFGFGVGTEIDLATSNIFATSFSRIQLKITLASQLADGAQVGPIRIHNTAINPQSNVITNIVGPVSGSGNSGAISASIVSSFIQNNTCSIFISNETGQAIEDNTIFTCSILLLK
jgi:hypothetical protein